MSEVEELLVRVRTALDAERQKAVNEVVAGVRDWDAYKYGLGRIDALMAAYDILNDEAGKLGMDEA